MKTITVPTREELSTKGQSIYDGIKQKLGMVPNLYATIGYSDSALESFLGFSSAAGLSSFSAKEIEAIKLAVSETNNCNYCLSAHTVLAKAQGFSEEETLAIRSLSYADERLNSVLILAAEIAENKGKASKSAQEAFFSNGFNEAALVDLISVVIAISFTNYTHILTQVPVDFPLAKELQEA